MKKWYKNPKTQAVWRRALAIVLALSMVLIPVKFLGAAKAVGDSVTANTPGNYFTDDFSNAAQLEGLTWKWNYVGSMNTAIADGKLNVGKEGKTGHNTAYLSATSGGVNYAENWTDYTVTAVVDRSHVPAQNYMGGILGRITTDENGKFSYYVIMVQGSKPGEAAAADPLIVKLFKITDGDELITYVGGFDTPIVIQGEGGKAKSTANEVKASFEGNKIRCWVDGDLVIDYVDETDPFLRGSAGVYQQTNWQLDVDSFRIDFANGDASFYDDFSDKRFENGVVAKWDGSQFTEVTRTIRYQLQENLNVTGTTQVQTAVNGTYHIWYSNHQSSKNSTSWLMLDSTEGEDKPLEELTEYSIEMDYVRHNWRGANNSQGYGAPWILFGLQDSDSAATEFTGYGIKLHSNQPMVGKVSTVTASTYVGFEANSYQNVPGVTGGTGAEIWTNIKVTVSGTKVTVSYSTAGGSNSKDFVFEDLQPGKIAIAFECSAVDTTNKDNDPTKPMGFEIDNLTVKSGGQQYFKETFDNNTSITTGVEQSFTIGRNAPAKLDLDYKWNRITKDYVSDTIVDGKYVIDSNTKPNGQSAYPGAPWGVDDYYTYISAEANGENAVTNWKDYSVKVQYSMFVDNVGEKASHTYKEFSDTFTSSASALSTGVYLIGRAQPRYYEGAFKGLEYYALKTGLRGLYISKRYWDEASKSIKEATLANISVPTVANDVVRYAELSFSGNVITVKLYDSEGAEIAIGSNNSYTDTGAYGEPLTWGGVGLRVDKAYEWFGANGSAQRHAWCFDQEVTFDDLTVTDSNGKTLLKETFTLAENQTAEQYWAATHAQEGAVLSYPSWTVSDGVLSGNAAGIAYLLASERWGTTDFAKEWNNYAIDADILLTDDVSSAGLIANYNAGSYYEVRLNKNGVGLYLVTPTAETELGYKEMALTLNQWYMVKLEVSNDGKTLCAYVDSDLVLDKDLTETQLAKGNMGVVIDGSAKFDNFAAYSVELSDSRIFKVYPFTGESIAELDPYWVYDDQWALENGKLVNTGAEGVTGVLNLKNKSALDNYNAELRFVAKEDCRISVIGRYDPEAETGYELAVDINDGIYLVKKTGSEAQQLGYISKVDLYKMDIRLIPGEEYTLKLYMYADKVWGFIGDTRVLAATDAGYTKGVTAVTGTTGATAVSLTTTEAFDVPALSLEDMKGNPVSSIVSYLGHTPDLKPYRVKAVYHDNSVKYADLDTLPLEGELSSTESGSFKVTYDYAELVVNYVVDAAEQPIAEIKAEIDALDLTALTLNNEAAVKTLAARYNALSATQKNTSFTAEQRKKIQDAQEIIELLRYPELADAPVVFRDDFEEYTPGKYDNNYLVNGVGKPGEWFVENGKMVMYMNRRPYSPTGFACCNEVAKRNFAVRSISVDVLLIDEKAWAGVDFHFKGDTFCSFIVTDKNDRIRLSTGSGSVTINSNSAELPEAERFDFETGVWYNLRVTFDNNLIKCYVNDRLFIEYEDESTIRNPMNESGTVRLRASENWVMYDNFQVRGTELEWKEEEQWYQINDNLPAGSYKDNFNDETVNADPSHWLELTTTDYWKVIADGENKIYGSTGAAGVDSASWLHVFETDVVYKAKLKVTALGRYGVAGLTARVNADTSYIKAGFDFTLNQWIIKYRYAADFAEVITYGKADTFALDTWYDLTLEVEGTSIKLYCGEELVAEADAGKKVSPGRVGVFTEQCDVQIDDVDLVLTSGQGRVQDGVMEQYTAQAGATSGTLYNVLPLPDGRYLLNQDNTHYISDDGGLTWQPTAEFNTFKGGSQLVLSNGEILNVKYAGGDVDGDGSADDTIITTYLSKDNAKTWTLLGSMNLIDESYAQPAEHLSEVVLDDGTHRIFYTNGKNTNISDDLLEYVVIAQIFYFDFTDSCDDFDGKWERSENTPAQLMNLKSFCESHILKTEGALPGDPLIHYSAYNSSATMRYSLSYDGGKTWVGDYAMPDIPCGLNTMTIEQDLETGIYYLATFMEVPNGYHSGFPRHRVVLLSSEDGFNWDFVCDVDRWGDVSGPDMGFIMQGVNLYLCVDKDYIFVTFSRSEEYAEGTPHQNQVGRLYRFEKAKLEEYGTWPEEYIINPNEILYIEAKPESTYVAEGKEFDPAGSKLVLHHYDGTTSEIDMSDAFVNQVVGLNGEPVVYVDYRHFRATFTLTEVVNEAPVVSGVEDGKSYCEAQTVTVSDVDLKSVTLNGEAVTLTDGKFVVSAKGGQQTIVGTDQLGNVTTVKITVNAGHTGGTATCQAKAECAVCGTAYGEKNADNHTKEAKWTITADKHAKAYECCGAVAVAEGTHTGGTATCKDKAVCSVCNTAYGELAAHKGGTATCTDKAKCEVCGESYGELNADKHTKEAKWTTTADKHSKAYECCGKVVVAEEAHEWKDGKCEECGYEAKAGTQQKPIEIPADKDTVKEEAKVEANEEKHYELDEALAGKTITVKGEGAYIVVDGKKYEAVNGVVEVKLPTKTGKISVVIGNAGTKAGTFSITVATPSQDNSDTGDNAAIALFGGLMALSILAAAALLIPDIRKKLMK